MTQHVSNKILTELSTAQMVDLYNQIPGVRQVTRFGETSTGRKRLALALERASLKLARVRGKSSEYRIAPVGAATALTRSSSLERRITVIVDANPKRPGTASQRRFALYRSGMTMLEYIETVAGIGVSRPKACKDMYDDRNHGYIRLEE